MSKLSNYFKYSEITHSNTAKANGIKNECSIDKARLLALRLDTIRVVLGHPMIVTGGYRSKELNDITEGASKTSAHMQVLAIDFTVNAINVESAFETLRRGLKAKNISFDQLIYYPKQNFIHIGFKENIADERKQVSTK